MKKKEKKKNTKKKLTIGTVPKSNKKNRSKRQNRYPQQQNTSHLPGLAQHFTKQIKTSYMGPTLLFPQVSTMPTLGF